MQHVWLASLRFRISRLIHYLCTPWPRGNFHSYRLCSRHAQRIVALSFAWKTRPPLFGVSIRYPRAGPKAYLQLSADFVLRRARLPLTSASCYQARGVFSSPGGCPCQTRQKSRRDSSESPLPKPKRLMRQARSAPHFFGNFYSTVIVLVRPHTVISCTPASRVRSMVVTRNCPPSRAINLLATTVSPSYTSAFT